MRLRIYLREVPGALVSWPDSLTDPKAGVYFLDHRILVIP
jgi:hypothetical protein